LYCWLSSLFYFLWLRCCLALPATMSVLQKIEDIEAEMAKTQKNKATAYVSRPFSASCWCRRGFFILLAP